jgi:hypothetical protein
MSAPERWTKDHDMSEIVLNVFACAATMSKKL